MIHTQNPTTCELASDIPAVGILRRRDLVGAAVRRSRKRRGGAGSRDVGLLDTFVLPDEREEWEAAGASQPGETWVQRPAVTTAGDPHWVVTGAEADQGPQWVIQRAVGPPCGQALPVAVRALAVLASVEPLVVYVLAGTLRELPGTDRRTLIIAPPESLLPVAALPIADTVLADTVLVDTVLSAVTEVAVATRELILRELRRDGHPVGRCFGVFGITTLLDREWRPWLLDVETSPLDRWCLPAGIAGTFLDAVTAGGASGDPARSGVPDRIGNLRRSVPGLPPQPPGAAWALPRPSDLALAAALADGTEPAAEACLRPAAGVRSWLLGTELALYVPGARDLLVVNTTGTFTWAALCDGLTADQTADELAVLGDHPAAWWRDGVRDIVAEWVEAGAVVPEGTAPSREPSPPAPPPLQARPLRWNPDHFYTCLGSSVLVRLPSRELARWTEQAVAGLRDHEPAQISAVVEVSADAGGWRVTGTHVAPRRCATAYQLPPAVRDAVLRSAARTSPHPAFGGSALEAEGTVTVVAGPAHARAGLIMAWVASGGRVLADEIIGIDDDAMVRPELAGLELVPGYQWLDGSPAPPGSPDAPMVNGQGQLVRYRFPAPVTVSDRAAAASALIVAGGMSGGESGEPLQPVSAGAALAGLLAWRVPGRPGFSEKEADRLVRWTGTVTHWTASLADPRRAVAALRAIHQ